MLIITHKHCKIKCISWFAFKFYFMFDILFFIFSVSTSSVYTSFASFAPHPLLDFSYQPFRSLITLTSDDLWPLIFENWIAPRKSYIWHSWHKWPLIPWSFKYLNLRHCWASTHLVAFDPVTSWMTFDLWIDLEMTFDPLRWLRRQVITWET